MKRVSIGLEDNMHQILDKMSEGNIGALTTLAKLLKHGGELALLDILCLDDMNIRGEQIWLGYKDHCGEDIERFSACIKSRDPEMVKTINTARGGTREHLAVEGGASFER